MVPVASCVKVWSMRSPTSFPTDGVPSTRCAARIFCAIVFPIFSKQPLSAQVFSNTGACCYYNNILLLKTLVNLSAQDIVSQNNSKTIHTNKAVSAWGKQTQPCSRTKIRKNDGRSRSNYRIRRNTRRKSGCETNTSRRTGSRCT